MLADVSEEMEGTSMPTFDDYVGALEKLFVIDDIEAWSPAIRSKTVIRTSKETLFCGSIYSRGIVGCFS